MSITPTRQYKNPRYNPNPLRREVRKVETIPGGVVQHVTESFTKDDGTKYYPAVDTQTGMVTCTCPDFLYRCQKHDPNVLTPRHWCKHLIQAIEGCVGRGELMLPGSGAGFDDVADTDIIDTDPWHHESTSGLNFETGGAHRDNAQGHFMTAAPTPQPPTPQSPIRIDAPEASPVVQALTPPPAHGIWNVDAETYHANRTHVNHSALTVFKRSVPEFAATYVHGTLQPPPANDAMRFGSALHCWLLEGEDHFWSSYCVQPRFDRRSREGKAAAAEFDHLHRGQCYLSPEEFDTVCSMSEAVKRNLRAKHLLDRTRHVEQTICWTDPYTQVACKARFDAVSPRAVLDVKTTADATPSAWARSVINFEYYRQAAWYLEGFDRAGCEALGADPFEEPGFYFIVIAKNPPYECVVYQLDDDLLRAGREENRALLTELADRRAREDWGSRYGNTVETVFAPAWFKGAAHA